MKRHDVILGLGAASTTLLGVPVLTWAQTDFPAWEVARFRGCLRHLCRRRLFDAAHRARAAVNDLVRPRFHGEGGHQLPVDLLPGVHKHLGRCARRSQVAARGRNRVLRFAIGDHAPDHTTGLAALHHGWPATGHRQSGDRHGDCRNS